MQKKKRAKPKDKFTPKKFDGKDYHKYSQHRKKAVAERQARELRDWPSVSGVRVLREGPSQYTVYVRQKPLPTTRREVSRRRTPRITPKTPRLRR